MKVPDTLGVPLMVMVLPANAAVTPVGNPVAAPIPVAPVVVCVMLVIALLIHVVAEPGPVTVLAGVTVMLPAAVGLVQGDPVVATV